MVMISASCFFTLLVVFILQNLPALQVQLTKSVLRIGVALLRRLSEPRDGGRRIFFYMISGKTQFPKAVHGAGVSAGGKLLTKSTATIEALIILFLAVPG